MKSGRGRAPSREHFESLAALYAEVDRAFSSTSCPGTSECCRFARTDREPFVTGLELAFLLDAAARRPRVSRPPAPLHETAPSLHLPVVNEERACPLLDASGRCSVYAARPLGCRTYFCERKTSYAPVPHGAVLAFVRRLQDCATKFDPSSVQGRPLMRALDLQRRPGRGTTSSGPRPR
ncbi:MAG: YkgJ family cysteine cluster protein [Polyangiaceae bacterium]